MVRFRQRSSGLQLFLLMVIASVLLSGCIGGQKVNNSDWAVPTVIYDRNGQEVYRFHAGEDRQPVKLQQIPEQVRGAFLAIEDPRFYEHGGLDFRGIVRAAYNNVLRAVGLRQSGLQGASTITQQLVRNRWLTQEQTLKRKLSEAWLALWLETANSKDEILEMYLNQVYFGHGAYGVERASRIYFGKSVADLKPAEAALLAGLINGPSIYDPYAHPEAAKARRNLVLDAMVKFGAVTPEEAGQLKQQKLGVVPEGEAPKGNAYVDRIIDILTRSDLAEPYGMKARDSAELARAGLKVYTALDSKLQNLAEEAVKAEMARADKQYGLSAEQVRPEAAAVMLEPVNGHVLALVGSRNRTGMREYNRATDARRQPGSAFKPFVAYLPAIENGLGPAAILDDAPAALTTDGKSIWPQNYDFTYKGLVPARYAVEQSLNPPAVRAMRAGGGPGRALSYARRFGFAHLVDGDAREPIALGGITHGVTPLELASAYGTLAYLGARTEPVLITKIEDADGKVLYSVTPRKEQIVPRPAAYLMIDMLKGVIQRGTAYGFTRGFNGWPAAGKTGTTDDNRDAWFAGFTPDLVTVVWTGYDTPRPLKWTGAFVPVQIWQSIMSRAVTAPPPGWAVPPEIVRVTVCRKTGMLPNDVCPPDQVATELFDRQHAPRESGNLLVRALVVKTPRGGWERWQVGCMAWPEQKVFINRPVPFVRHPLHPNDPRFVPADAGQELPQQVCKPTVDPPGWLKEWFRPKEKGR